ncbi:HlyD family secretion protein [Pseudomonas sp.]|uniref:HlyD family secretion protein n=1 Tax=Pseudomonas sp. TaxID=306 RepID=UPI0039C95DF1
MFRPAALARQGHDGLGMIILVRPLSFAVFTALALAMATIVIAFLCLGSYTQRSTVAGQLVPATGQVKVYAPQAGVVLERYVQEGEPVQRGQPLLALSSERYVTDLGAVQAGITRQLDQRLAGLSAQSASLQRLQASEREVLASKLASQRRQIAVLDEQQGQQQQRVALALDAVRRYRELVDKGYISTDQLQQREADLLAQRQALHGLTRDRLGLAQQLGESSRELDALADRQANALNDLDQQVAALRQERVESESRRDIVIKAPESGIATAVFAEVGMSVDSTRNLMSIVPAGAALEAELYAPSRTIGFIEPGDQVLMRFEAFPYQKFGQQRGTVLSISRASVAFNDLATMVGSVPGSGQDGEQHYRIRVRLAQQMMFAYGQQHGLQSGMLLEADVLRDTRRLYEWVLDPLLSLTGKLKGAS